MTTDSLSKINTARMSGRALARAAGLNPNSAQARELARRHGKAQAIEAPAQPVSPSADDWPEQVAAAVAKIAEVPLDQLRNPLKRDRQIMTARRAMVRALRRQMTAEKAGDWLAMHYTTVSKLAGQADVHADTIAERALARVEGR